MTVAVTAVGNEFRRDDGVALRVVEVARPRLPEGATVHVLDGEPARMIEAWAGARAVVIVDAVRWGAEPGTVTVTELGREAALLYPDAPTSSHRVGPAEAVALARGLDRAPERTVIVAVEVSDVGHGTGLSAAVEQAVEPAAHEVVAAVNRLSGQERSGAR